MKTTVRAVILAVVILLLALPGCGKNSKSSDLPDPSPQPSAGQQETRETLPTAPASKPADKTTATALSTATIGWGITRNNEHLTPSIPDRWKTMLQTYDGYYVGDTTNKVLYLTFDEGYENGYTGQILDTLKAADVKAAFFVTEPYIKRNPELIKRMVAEGHLVCNHTSTHPNLAPLSREAIARELSSTAGAFKDVTGQEMPRFVRPPQGQFSQQSLAIAQSLGYKTIFWSFAYADWDRTKQPGKDVAYKTVMDNVHPGAILLLHAVSQSNKEALPDLLRDLSAQGYTFASLDSLPER